jgi:hypothetical protein
MQLRKATNHPYLLDYPLLPNVRFISSMLVLEHVIPTADLVRANFGLMRRLFRNLAR